jgi:agmatinase
VGFKDLYIQRKPLVFGGFEWERSRTVFSLLGVPFDSTSSFKPGSRFAPDYLRFSSRSLELYSIRSSIDMEEIGIYDEGDIAVSHGDPQKTLEILENVVRELVAEGRIPILLGGEHTVSLGSVKGLSRGTGVLVLDAHMDLRDDFMGNKYSHACVSRRLLEILGPGSMFMVGVRAFTRDEMRVAMKNGVEFITAPELRREGRRAAAGKILRWMDNFKDIYISIDIDVLDPAFAPGTGTPEPDGIATWELLDLLHEVVDERTQAFDLVEVNPMVDTSGITSALGAKIVFEVASYIYSKRLKRKG